MTVTLMDPQEAKRRFEKLLVLSGYSMSGHWVERGEKDHNFVYSMALRNMSDCRALLWFEGDQWVMSISVWVGEEGEFPLWGGRLTRFSAENKLRSFNSLSSRIDEVRAQVRRWDFEMATSQSDKAMIKLALSYLRDTKPKKAASILLATLRGEISMATISESLSIVQLKWARSREEKLRSALIWSQTFK